MILCNLIDANALYGYHMCYFDYWSKRTKKIYFNVLDDKECVEMFDCGYGECISHEMACDGFPQCSNKKDEQICTNSQGNSYSYLLCASTCKLLHLPYSAEYKRLPK